MQSENEVRQELAIPFQREMSNDDIMEAIQRPVSALTTVSPPLSIQGSSNQAFVGCNFIINSGPHVENEATSRETQEQERFPCEETTDILLDKYIILVEALKRNHKKKYCNVKPLPYVGDYWLCVKDIFVESKISVMNGQLLKNDSRRWSPITCRHEILENVPDGKRIIVEGEAGFGKTTLLLQYAYDWCTSSPESPLKEVDIFILLRLKKLANEPSIFDAIRSSLPDDLHLTSQDIKDIITNDRWKVVLAFDAYDEYFDREVRNADVAKIIQGRLLSCCLVIVTTRPICLQKLQGPTLKQYRLSGFDRGSQEEYVEKVMASRPAKTSMKKLVITKLRESDILFDICKVPLIFAMLAHVIFLNNNNQHFNSVTSNFSFMLSCLFSHVENKDTVRKTISVNEEPTHRLAIARMAFDGLTATEKRHIWRKDDIIDNHTNSPLCFKEYIETGILLEEQRTSFQIKPGAHEESQILETSYIQFLHVSFQEFYAAHNIVNIVRTENKEVVNKELSKISIHDHPNVFRFACGLNPSAAVAVHRYLQTLGNTERIFSLVCKMEQDKDFDQVITRVKFQQVGLKSSSSRLDQLSKIQLLQAASVRKIPTTCLYLSGCFDSVDLTEECLLLNPYGLRLSKLDTLEQLVIRGMDGRDLRKKAPDILYYATKCETLKHLRFSAGFPPVILPQSFEDQHVLAALQRRGCIVSWGLWKLNLLSRRWEHEGREITETDYNRVIKYRRLFNPLQRKSKYRKGSSS